MRNPCGSMTLACVRSMTAYNAHTQAVEHTQGMSWSEAWVGIDGEPGRCERKKGRTSRQNVTAPPPPAVE